jgi:glycosyltransferase involved in cell wall biosynthesis
MSIGVAVPCYNKHIPRLFELLDSIEKQTIKPKKVCISCSSTREDEFVEALSKYSFPTKVIITEGKKNAAENRNTALNHLLELDYITFMDADDIMHPQRIEILLKAFKENDADIILHNYQDQNDSELFQFKKIVDEDISIKINSLQTHWSGCVEHIDYYKYQDEKIHHSQVSVKREVVDYVKFPEESEYTRREDCIFCFKVFQLPNMKNVYIANKLSYYNPSYTEMN